MRRNSVGPESFRPCLDIPKHVQGIRFGASVGKNSFPDPIFGHQAAARNAFMRQVPFGALSALSFGPADLLSSPGSRHHKHDARLRRDLAVAFMVMNDFRRAGLEGALLSATRGRLSALHSRQRPTPVARSACKPLQPPTRYLRRSVATILKACESVRRVDRPFTCPAQNMRSFGWSIHPSRSRGQPILDQHLKANHLLPKRRDS